AQSVGWPVQFTVAPSIRAPFFLFFFQAEDGIRDFHVTGVQTCALPISRSHTPQGEPHMSRIAIPADIGSAPAAAQPLLQAVNQQLGSVPTLFRLVATSPAALEGYLGMSGALGKGSVPAPTRERIALAVAEINGCSYCLSAHTYLGKNLAKLDDAELAPNRSGT